MIYFSKEEAYRNAVAKGIELSTYTKPIQFGIALVCQIYIDVIAEAPALRGPKCSLQHFTKKTIILTVRLTIIVSKTI